MRHLRLAQWGHHGLEAMATPLRYTSTNLLSVIDENHRHEDLADDA
jgi:hypothetical protein